MKIEININESPVWIPELKRFQWDATAIVNGIPLDGANVSPLLIFALAETPIVNIAAQFTEIAVTKFAEMADSES